ncbi:MAG: hypothetical protein K6G23_04740 [Lachnospiraceae bacterium]|nr:hypothetical protein [Lachnospiraceae bacterium]
MNERIYKAMRRAGTANIVLGIIVLAVGIASGVLLIVGGARLLAHKGKILF